MTEFLFWFFALLILYPYILYPVVLWWISLFLNHNYHKGSKLPTISLIISAYNEEKIIEAKIKNTLALDYPRSKLQIIVASESTDRTDQVVSEYSGNDVELMAYPDRRGKASTLFRTVPRSSGEILVFSDANSMYRPDALRKLARHFEDDRVGCVSGTLKYYKDTPGSAGESESSYSSYDHLIKTLESKLGTVVGAYGCIFALRREAYAPLSEFRGDDFELPMAAAINGWAVLLDAAAISMEHAGTSYAMEFNRKIRIISRNFESGILLLRKAATARSLLPAVLLVSHKILRWLIPYFLLGLLATTFFLAGKGTVYTLALLSQIIVYGAALGAFALKRSGRRSLPKFLSLPYYFCVMNTAALIGVWKAVRGRTEVLWEKQR